MLKSTILISTFLFSHLMCDEIPLKTTLKTYNEICYDTKHNNPCTEENTKHGHFYFPSCSSCCNFIQCDESANAFDMPCPQGTFWDQKVLTCNHNNGQCKDNKCAQNPIPDTCPGLFDGTPIENYSPIPTLDDYKNAVSNLNIKSVIQDIQYLLHNSQSCWPADEFTSGTSYGPLFIRLAWHCSGTFRTTDGAGGCAGGRQRFSPEKSWEDNTNLDKARALLAPIKNKYGIALSWGDLMILAGYASIIDMGGPVNKICVGRIDEADGTNSLPLGPSALQEDKYPCRTPGNCPRPLGSAQIELIYVNPEGFMGQPNPETTAQNIREIFDRMGMNDKETVALIGGGHAFGKSHGACVAGHGLGPNESPYNPWPGNCGSGKGKDTFTSGIEGQWTSDPLKWDNEYFRFLNDDGHKYELIIGPGNKYQWRNKENGYMMMTSDIALIYDDKYDEIVDEFANDIHKLEKEFADAWSKLTSRGGQWIDTPICIDINNYGKNGGGNLDEKKNYY